MVVRLWNSGVGGSGGGTMGESPGGVGGVGVGGVGVGAATTGDETTENWFSSSSFSWNLGTTVVMSPSSTTHNNMNANTPTLLTTRNTDSSEASAVLMSSDLNINNNASGTAAPAATESSSSYFTWLSSPWEATYSTVAGAVSSFYKEDSSWLSPLGGDGSNLGAGGVGVGGGSSMESDVDVPLSSSSILLSLQRRRQQQGRRQQQQKRKRPVRSNNSNSSSSSSGINWNSTSHLLFRNPYQSVRGQLDHSNREQSMSAIRSFISLVPDIKDDNHGDMEEEEQDGAPQNDHDDNEQSKNLLRQSQGQMSAPTLVDDLDVGMPMELALDESVPKKRSGHGGAWAASQPPPPQPWYHARDGMSLSELQQLQQEESQWQALTQRADATAETAAHLAEGMIRAWRDLALEEAVELNAALRFWSNRWEQPGLSFLEAGPQVWLSEGGYNHRHVGKLVAQSQAVLARRCAAIGELQQHLLQSGWQRGVAQWSVLGQGGHWWARVAPGFDGSIQPEEEYDSHVRQHQGQEQGTEPAEVAARAIKRDYQVTETHQETSSRSADDNADSTHGIPARPSRNPLHQTHGSYRHFPGGSAHESTNDLKRGEGADVIVRNLDGGGTFVDDPSFLAKWSVDAIALVRRQLFRASNGTVPLPFASNWLSPDDNQDNPIPENDFSRDDADNVIVPPAKTNTILPRWAIDAGQRMATTTTLDDGVAEQQDLRVMIADLPVLTAEVSELLNTMEDVMAIQRQRRLDRLQPPKWWRRNWYLLATSVPLGVWLIRHFRFRTLVSSVARTVKYFFVTRIQAPVMAIYEEIWKGRTSFSDKKARMEAMEVLKKMIKSWLDENYPAMPNPERQRLANAMDVSLVEETKENSMKSLGFNTFEVVRMSFIEMQWLKKEMMNALHAMDEVMSANDINMNLAAITPVVMFAYVQTRIIKYLFYALLRIGKSREEIYASFRAILLDIERLLVMRDNPPDARCVMPVEQASRHNPSVLGADDLGMLMLLIHECRTILWRERRRFTSHMIRSVNEDLSELAGERGTVSIKQQLQIVARMTRSYPFLKVISTGHFFEHHSQLRRD